MLSEFLQRWHRQLTLTLDKVRPIGRVLVGFLDFIVCLSQNFECSSFWLKYKWRHIFTNISLLYMFQQKAWKMNFSNNIVYMKQNKINIERLKFFNNLGKLKRFNERKSLVVMLICFNGWFDPDNDDPHSSSAVVIIISQNSSKSMVPDPSSSISAMMPSRSSSVRLESTSARMPRNWAIVMKP